MKSIRAFIPAGVVLVYLLCVFLLFAFIYGSGCFIPLGQIDGGNAFARLAADGMHMIVIAVVLALAVRLPGKHVAAFGITAKSSGLVFCLLAVYVAAFFLRGDFSVRGIYLFWFYLIFVAFAEEIVFRGYLFATLAESMGVYMAILVSGVIWGAAHAILPAIVKGASFAGFLFEAAAEMGGGVAAGAVFAWMCKRSGNLLAAVLVHAILDYFPILRLSTYL